MDTQTPSSPPLEPFHTQKLAVDATHTLYVEQNGCLQGVAAVFLHGGPGGSCQEAQRQLFDPDIFHAVLFDQRGCGRSTPYGPEENRRFKGGEKTQSVADYSIPPDINSKILGL